MSERRDGGPPLGRVAWRSLSLQASYNPEQRQGLGVAAALAPVAAKTVDAEARRRFLLRHVQPYNTNPVLAGPLLGALVRLEEQGLAGDAEAEKRAIRLKRIMEAPLAATGDALFWNGIRPAAAALGAAVAWTAGVWGPLLFLALYNGPHLGIRFGGLYWGYRRGEGIADLLRADWVRGIRLAAPWLLLAGLAVLGVLAFAPASGPEIPGALALAAGYLLGRRGVPRGTVLALGAIIIGLIVATVVRYRSG